MQRYTLGFCFSDYCLSVLLVKKNKPDFLAGRLNGVGGKLEEGEKPLAGMIREFEEEAGSTIDSWENFATLFCYDSTGNPTAIVYCFVAFDEQAMLTASARGMNDVGEVFKIVDPDDFDHPIVPNLRWLIPMAISNTRNDWPYQVHESRR